MWAGHNVYKEVSYQKYSHHLTPKVLEAVLEVDVADGDDAAAGAVGIVLSRPPVEASLLEPLEVGGAVYLALLVEPREVHEHVTLVNLPCVYAKPPP